MSALLRSIRFLIAACFSVLLLFSYTLPAYSANSSHPHSGEANLLDIERKSQEAVLSDPYDMNKQVKETNPGLNEVQGTADIEKMKRPDNTFGIESVEEKIGKALEKVEGK